MERWSPAMLDALATACALDLLGVRVRRRFEAMQRAQPALAAAVAARRAWLAALHGSVPCAAVPPALRTRLERRLFGAPLPEPAPPASPAPQRAAPAAPRPRRAARAAWWPPAFGMAMGAMLSVALLSWRPSTIGLEPAGDALPASYVGVLADGEGRGGLVVSSRRFGRVLNLKLVRPLAALPPPQQARLWAYTEDGTPPFVLATLAGSGKATVLLPDASERLFARVTRLAVHADQPDQAGPGTLLLSGPCAKLW